MHFGRQLSAVFIDLTKHIFGSSDMLQRNGALFEEVRPQQFAVKKDGNGDPASPGGSCHGKLWKTCKCKVFVKEGLRVAASGCAKFAEPAEPRYGKEECPALTVQDVVSGARENKNIYQGKLNYL